MVFMIVNWREFNGDSDWEWVNEQIPLLRSEDTRGIMFCNAKTGELVGACICERWTITTVQCHMMVNEPAVFIQGGMEVVFDYLFNFHNRKKIYGYVLSTVKKAKKLLKHMGFDEVAELENAWDEGVNISIFELKKENCRYLAGG